MTMMEAHFLFEDICDSNNNQTKMSNEEQVEKDKNPISHIDFLTAAFLHQQYCI